MTRFFDGPRPRVLAHRGLALDAPENTLLAFAHAVAAGATHVETDVHATLDGVAVVTHDPDLERVGGDARRVSLLTLEQVRAIRLPEGQGVPTLREALEAFPDTCFNVDVKAPEAVRPTIEAVLAAGAGDRVLLTSFSEVRRRATVAGLPGVATSASSRGVALAVAASLVPWGPARRLLVRAATRGVRALQVPERYGRFRVVTRWRVAALAEVGVETHVWVVDDPADMRRLVALGVAGVVTDRADLALATLVPPPAV